MGVGCMQHVFVEAILWLAILCAQALALLWAARAQRMRSAANSRWRWAALVCGLLAIFALIVANAMPH